jgi:putative ABC transport system permease protein
MRFLRILGPSLRTLLAHRVRSFLAAAGVAIGIAAVFFTNALGEGAQAEVLGSLGAMGTRLLVVRPAQLRKSVARREIQGFASSLKLEDFEAIAGLPGLEAAAPSVEGAAKIEADRGLIATRVLGTTSDFFRALHFEVREGRLFDDEEEGGLARLAVLGGRIAASLFPDGGAVGREVRIGRAAFEVVGVLVPKGASADGADVDNQIFIPIRTAMRRLFDSRCLSAIFVGVRRSDDLSAVEAEIRALLRERHLLDRRGRPDDFGIQSQLRFLSAQRKIARPLSLFSIGLSALSLFVGGAGILALMLLTVRERRWEIGLRMAVGARPRDILFQFLAEALALALAGGAAGVAIGALGAWGISLATKWAMGVSGEAALVSVALAAGIGLVFGGLPAWKAARVPPVQALGME